VHHDDDANADRDGAAGAVAEMEAAIADLRRAHPPLLPLTQLQAANVLADLGAREAARRTGLAALDWPPTNRVIALVGDLLRVRFDVLDGQVGPVDEVLAHLRRLEALGHRRQAGTVSLRMARDHARVGALDQAETLRAWGLERIPPPGRRSRWEQRWAWPRTAPDAPDDRPAGSRSRRVRVRVLAPVLEVAVDGSPVAMRTMAAKLLLALVIAHPAPLHIEQAVDVLWPEAPFGQPVRPRLNTVVHRLRAALGLDPSGLRRTGDILVLDVEGWDVDLLRLRRTLRDPGVDDDRRRAALGEIRGNLCDVQFPYDDHFCDHRRVVAAEAARAIEAIERAAGGPPDAELTAVRRRLDLSAAHD
jgi:hypothetical protein